MNLKYGRSSNIGINYVIEDNTKLTSSETTTSEVQTLDALFVIHADKGVPNKTFTKMTLANFLAEFGEVTAKKHGIQAAACYKLLTLGHTASVCRVDEGAKISNLYPELTFTASEEEVYIYGGKLFNVTAAQIDAGDFDAILEELDITGTTFKATAKKVSVPVMSADVAVKNLTDVTDTADFAVQTAALYTEGAGTLNIKNRTIVPFVMHAPGGGLWGDKISGAFGSAITLRNTVPTKSLVISYNSKAINNYSGIGLVPDISDELGIQLYLGAKLRDKTTITNYIGDLHLRMTHDRTNENGFEEALIEYYTELLAKLETLLTDNIAAVTAGSGDADLNPLLQNAITTYTTLLDKIDAGDVHPFQLINWDGNAIFTNALGYNLVYATGSILPDSFTLKGGDNGTVKGMRKFDYDYKNASGKAVGDLYESYFKFEIDPDLRDISLVRPSITFNFDYPNKVRTALIEATKHAGEGLRGDIMVVGGAPGTIKTVDEAVEYAKAVKMSGGKYLTVLESCEVYDAIQNKNMEVSAIYPLLNAISAWYIAGRRNPWTDYPLGDIVYGSVYPRVPLSSDQTKLYNYDINTLKYVDGSYRLRTQTLMEYGYVSKLKEAHNQFNFCELIKDTHFAIEKHQKGVSEETTLTSIQENIGKELEGYSAYFQGAPTVSIFYEDADAEARGEADLEVAANMFGTVKTYNTKFIVNSATSGK